MSNTPLPPKVEKEKEDVQTEILNTLNRIQYCTQRTEQHTSMIRWAIICIMFFAVVIPVIMTAVWMLLK